MEFHVNQSPEAHYTVYKLTAPNGKIYIGCTGKKPEYRWNCGRGYSHNSVLYAAIQKYGWEAFKKEIICEKLTKEGAERIERQLVDILDTRDLLKGYNFFAGGNRKGSTLNSAGKYVMKISKEKLIGDIELSNRISQTCKRKQSTPEYKAMMSQRTKEYQARTGDIAFRKPIPVICIETGEYFSSMMAASRAVGVGHSSIGSVCKGLKHTAAGYHWRYA